MYEIARPVQLGSSVLVFKWRTQLDREVNQYTNKTQKSVVVVVVMATLLLTVNIACAQDNTTPKKRLRSPATVKGFIGGESHDSYVIRVRKGQILSVQISWRRADDNHAEFIVSESPNFGGQVEFGKESDKGKRWSGKIPKTENYYIYVTAHPTAHYALRVTVK